MNIAIVENNDLYRESLTTALSQIPQFRVRFECRDCSDALAQIARRAVDVILVNSAVCKEGLSEFVKKIHLLSPGTKILMLLDHTEECWYTQAIRCGADDAIPRHSAKNVLEELLRGLTNKREVVRARRMRIT